jgi:dipeptidase E
MKIFLHSDQTISNNEVDQKIFDLLNPKDIKIGYIPAGEDLDNRHYDKKRNWYRQYGVNNFMKFELGSSYDESKLQELYDCDLIHLSGGNTFQFLENIKKRNFKDFLLKYIKKGGVLVGISAGSYVMTPTIKITTLYKDNPPIMNYIGMNLVDFEFLPHYQNKKDMLNLFLEYSKNNNDRKIYLCEDNDGIYINDNEIELIGDLVTIRSGEIIS